VQPVVERREAKFSAVTADAEVQTCALDQTGHAANREPPQLAERLAMTGIRDSLKPLEVLI